MRLAAGVDRAQEAGFAQHDAIGNHFTLRNRRAETPGGRDQHVAFGRFAQAPAGGARRNKRLDEHAHRGVGRREAVIFHVAARMRRPQRRPAGAHGGEEFGFVGQAEEAFELPGEVGALAILDQRRGAHHTERRDLALLAPGGKQRLENFRRDRLFVEREPDLDRDAARGRHIAFIILAEQVLDAEVTQLLTIGVRRQRKAAGRRQSGLRQACKIRRFRADPFRIGGKRIVKLQNESGH